MNAGNTSGDFSIIIKSIKWNYTLNYKKAHHISTSFSLWQRGFWDHIIRDEQDLKNHIDYIHWNPLKHRVAKFPQNWKYSTYQFWVDCGFYSSHAVIIEPPSNILKMDLE
jgi:putative transposase